MNQKSKEFFEKLACLLEEYGVEMEITESCYGYGGFQVDGLEFGIPSVVEDSDFSYAEVEYVEFGGRFHDAKSILDDVKNRIE